MENLIGKEVFEFHPHEQAGNPTMNYDDKYYTVSKGKIGRINEQYGLVYVGGFPYPINDLERNTKPNKNGYRHWLLKS